MIIQRFARNTAGRDFACGDVHGHFELLSGKLAMVEFDPSRDRLFAVGDLVDRGPFSVESVEWIGRPWFHSVPGNHEMIAMGVAAGRHDAEHYLKNGGLWFLKLTDEQRHAIAQVFATLPYAIEIDTSHGRVGIVHAEIQGNSWGQFIADFESATSNNKKRELIEKCLWSRKIIDAFDEDRTMPEPINDLHRLIVGHSIVDTPTTLQNILYIDTGAYKTGNLTVIQIDGPTTGASQ